VLLEGKNAVVMKSAVDSVTGFEGEIILMRKCRNIKRSMCSKRGKIHLSGKMM